MSFLCYYSGIDHVCSVHSFVFISNNYSQSSSMPKQVIVIMQDHYPFGECEECSNDNTRVLVRKIYQVSLMERNKLLEKVGILRRLRNEHMIRIESVLEQEESIHFLFEYIPIKLETWISNINDEFIENFRDQLIKFSSFLANSNIRIDFRLKNIGMDQNYGAKYFLDLDFEVDFMTPKEKLKSNYIRQITNLFRPYLTPPPDPKPTDRQPSHHFRSRQQQQQQEIQAQQERKNDTSISPPTNKVVSKNKEKALEKYYQEVNMSVDSENEKILQEFMDVLDNEEEEPKPIQSAPLIKQQSPPAPQPDPSFNKVRPPQPAQLFHSAPRDQPPSPPLKQPPQQQYNAVNNSSAMESSGAMNISKYKEESAELQSRVKSAIEKSLDVIKKFKQLKDTSSMM